MKRRVEGGLLNALRSLRTRIRERSHLVEEGLFLILALAFAGFAVHWLRLIFL